MQRNYVILCNTNLIVNADIRRASAEVSNKCRPQQQREGEEEGRGESPRDVER